MKQLHTSYTRLAAAALTIVATGAAIAQIAIPALERVPNGQLVGSFVGRYNLDSERTGQILAYISQMHGFPNSLLFNNETAEANARFSIVSTPLRLELIRTGLMIHARPQPVSGDAVRFRIYYDELAQNHDYTNPETLTNGRVVATFRARPWTFTAIRLLTAHAEGVLELESSEDFFVQGQRVNLRQAVEAMRLQVHGGPVPAGRSSDETLSFPIGGSAISVTAFPRAEQ